MASRIVRTIASLLSARRQGERAFFDEAYYRRSYADIAAAGVDAFTHFAAHGWREGRNPSATFNTLYYRDAHLDGAAIDPLAHWVEAGGPQSGLATAPPTPVSFILAQRPVVAPNFDQAFYLAQAGAAVGDPVGHYLAEGWRKGLSPSPDFDPTRYGEENRFVATLDVSPFYHWSSQRRLAESGRDKPPAYPAAIPPETLRAAIEPEFDRAYYLARQSDVREAGLEPLKHFLDHGWREGRDPHALFDSFYYLKHNRDVAGARLNPFYHYLTVGRAEGRRANPMGTHLYPPMRAPVDWREACAAADTAAAAWVVVIPVYRGYDETLAAIYAVLTAPQRLSFALHVVNDRSPDEALVAELERLAASGLFSFETNPTNLGFVRTCNRALRAFPDKEVVLLNADALVFGDWLDRMAAHAARDATIATITPFSNNATICSYPVNNSNNVVEPEVDAPTMDRIAAVANAGRVSELATGVGFCFFMSRASRAAIGLFDEAAFGRGYGEENDFCLRAAKAGYRNVLAEDIFAYHRGEVSFADLAAGEYGPGQKALAAKHPDYSARVGLHLRADPGLRGRMRLDLARLARHAGPRTMVFVSHALSGGIVTHIRHMEQRLAAEGVGVVHLRVGVKGPWNVEVASEAPDAPFLPNLQPTSIHQIGDLLAEFLNWLDPIAIHLHSMVGFDWRATQALLDLVRGSSVPYYVTLHDYSVVCHRNDLVLTDGRYCGLPAVEACRDCVAHDRSYPEAIDPAVRRQTFDRVLRGAAAVFAPSADVAERLARAGARYRIHVRPHEEDSETLPPVLPPPEDATRLDALHLHATHLDAHRVDVVAVGALGAHKGSRILLNLARDAQARALPLHFHIVGFSDVGEELKGVGVIETGRYGDDVDAAAEIAAIRPALMLLPSIWPETFCYTLSLAFRLGVPPVVFDLGAQAARVRDTGVGHILPLALIDDPGAMNDRLLALAAEERPAGPPVAEERYGSILRNYYALDVYADMPAT